MTDQALFELPADLREDVTRVAAQTQIPVEWLVHLYQRGVQTKIGATGRHPYGKLSDNDEGELAVGIAADGQHGVVRLEFGKAIRWLALPPAHGRQFAKLLLEACADVERKIS